jgi:hypothetical protein
MGEEHSQWSRLATEKLLPAVIVMSTAALALGYWIAGLRLAAVLVVAVGAAWILGLWLGHTWVSSAGLLLFSGASAAGVLFDAGIGWMLAGLALALAAWDLGSFVHRVRSADRSTGTADLERKHLTQLSVVILLGIALAILALAARVRMGFALALLLGLLAVIGLSRAFEFLRRESD